MRGGLRLGLGQQGGAGDEHATAGRRRSRPPRRTASGCRAARRGRSQRASRPAAVARRAPPCVWITPLGAPRLPEVNMIARSSAGRTRASIAATSSGRPAPSAELVVGQTWRSDGARGDAAVAAPEPPPDAGRAPTRARRRSERSAERRRDDQVGDARRAQLGQQLGRPQQRAERHEHGADPHASPAPSPPTRCRSASSSPTRSPLPTPAATSRAAQRAARASSSSA